jgi:hypothetical protein
MGHLSGWGRQPAGRLRPTVRQWLKQDIGQTNGGSNRSRGATSVFPLVGNVLALVKSQDHLRRRGSVGRLQPGEASRTRRVL